MKKRYILEHVKHDLEKKIVFITGPRQCGKTTFSKSLTSHYSYINYDDIDHRQILLEKSWNRNAELVIFDEIHKMHEWKRFLKGIYDTEGIPPQIIVTGSAKLNTFRKVGDSLAGRFFKFRMYPFDVKELNPLLPQQNADTILDQLLETSGFPEPYLEGSTVFYRRWRKSHLDVILRQDLVDLTSVRHISDIETLILLLRKRIGTPISYASLARDLQVSPQTVQNWCAILEAFYIVFKVTPYHRNVARSILKEPKYYFFDTAFVDGDQGTKLENQMALSLLKEIHYLEDTTGVDVGLYYLRNKQGKEVDFLVDIDQNYSLIEVKWADQNLSPNLAYFSKYFNHPMQIQIVKNCKREKSWPNGAILTQASKWMVDMKLKKGERK